MKLTVGSLFAGIGGFDLGFERAGFDIKWQVELDPFATAVLACHFPDAKHYGDVRAVHGVLAHAGTDAVGCEGAQTVCASSLEPVDIICGGFPCQPHSLAGRRAGASDERDLWPEFARLIREVRPRWVVAENVPGLLSSDAGRFFGTILRDLATCGYDAEWDCISAADMGAPHLRERIWIVAYPRMGNPASARCDWTAVGSVGAQEKQQMFGERSADVAISDLDRLEGYLQSGDGDRTSPRIFTRRAFAGGTLQARAKQWGVEPDVGRVAHGVSARVDRLRGLGNSIVPQIAEWIAHRIKEAEIMGMDSVSTR